MHRAEPTNAGVLLTARDHRFADSQLIARTLLAMISGAVRSLYDRRTPSKVGGTLSKDYGSLEKDGQLCCAPCHHKRADIAALSRLGMSQANARSSLIAGHLLPHASGIARSDGFTRRPRNATLTVFVAPR